MKPARHSARTPLASVLLLLCTAALPLSASHAAAPGSPAASTPPAAVDKGSPAPAAPPAATPGAYALAEIAPAAQAALTTLKNFEPEDSADASTGNNRTTLRDLTGRVDQLHDQNARASVATTGSLDTLRDLQAGWKKVQTSLVEFSQTLGSRGKALEGEAAQVKELESRWQATRTEIRKADVNAPEQTGSAVDSVLAATRAADGRIKSRQTANLELQNSLGALLTRADEGENAIDQALADAVKALLVRDQTPLWESQAQPGPDVARRWRASATEQWAETRAYVAGHQEAFALHAGIFLGLLAVFFWLRRGLHQLTEEDPQLQRAAPIFEVPIATALALSFVLKGPIYAAAPVFFKALLGAVVLVPTVRILRRLLARQLALVLYSLIIFYALDQVRNATLTLPAVNRWIFCGEMAAALGVFVALLRLEKSPGGKRRFSLGKWMPLINVLAAAGLAAALGANVLGYGRLATLLGSSILISSYLGVFLYALLRVVEGLTFIALRVRPVNAFRIAQMHREQVQAVVYRVCRGAAVLFWLSFTLGSLQLRAPLLARTENLLDYQMPLGSIHLTLWQLLSFAGAIWFSVLASRLIRFFLDEEVYERVQLSPGLPYAISTMLNYAVLLIGFLIALGLLGVDLTKITIVAGAFSVGLGFGLQNIINNFVSGVILLFERPVKVGDVIQLGDAVGEVRRIGIRASIIRTRDGSDLIVPNGNLISNQVTNWTYADRCRAVEIAFNFAAECDPHRVVALLQATAGQQPAAADRPPPQVYITGITATGLSVVVRAWTTHYEDWIEVRSDLTAALMTALTREKIKLV